jgi:hypothetical protein
MNPTTTQKQERLHRLEDSFSLPENQLHLPVDYLVEEEDRKLVEKWHKKNLEAALHKETV